MVANLSVAFVGDPLNLNLFPPHVSGVAAEGGGKREGGRSGEVRGHGGGSRCVSSSLKCLFGFVLPRAGDSAGSREAVDSLI